MTPDIWYKLQKLTLGPGTPLTEIPKAAPSVHYKKDIEVEEKSKEKQKPKTKGRLSYSALRPNLLRRVETLKLLLETTIAVETWPLEVKPKAPCPKCKEPDDWVCDCPGSRRGRGPEPLMTLD